MTIPITDITTALAKDQPIDLAFRGEPVDTPVPWMTAIRVGAGTIQVVTDVPCHFWISGTFSSGTVSAAATLASPGTVVIAVENLITSLTSLGLYGTATDTAEFDDILIPRLVGLTNYTVSAGAYTP